MNHIILGIGYVTIMSLALVSIMHLSDKAIHWWLVSYDFKREFLAFVAHRYRKKAALRGESDGRGE